MLCELNVESVVNPQPGDRRETRRAFRDRLATIAAAQAVTTQAAPAQAAPAQAAPSQAAPAQAAPAVFFLAPAGDDLAGQQIMTTWVAS